MMRRQRGVGPAGCSGHAAVRAAALLLALAALGNAPRAAPAPGPAGALPPRACPAALARAAGGVRARGMCAAPPRAGPGGLTLALRGGFDTGAIAGPGNDDEDVSAGFDPEADLDDHDGLDAPGGYAPSEGFAGSDAGDAWDNGSSGRVPEDSDASGASVVDEPSSAGLPADAHDAHEHGPAGAGDRKPKVVQFDPSSDEKGEEQKWLQQVDAFVHMDDAQGALARPALPAPAPRCTPSALSLAT